MAKNILVINVDIRETRVALIENGIIAELHLERHGARGTLGNVCVGKVSRVLPGMQAAFIDIGQERAAFLHVEDLIRPDDLDAYLSGRRSSTSRSSDDGAHSHEVPEEGDEDVVDVGPSGVGLLAAVPEDDDAHDHDLPSATVEARAPSHAPAEPLPVDVASAVALEAPPGLEPEDDDDEELVAPVSARRGPVDAPVEDPSGPSSEDEDEDDEAHLDVETDDDADDLDENVLDEHADDEHSDDEHSDDEHADDEHSDDEHADDEHSDDEHSDDEHSDDEHSDDEHSDDDDVADDDVAAAAPFAEGEAVASVGAADATGLDISAVAVDAEAAPAAPLSPEDEAALQSPRARTRRGGRGRRRRGKTRPDGVEAEAAPVAVAPAEPAPRGQRGDRNRQQTQKSPQQGRERQPSDRKARGRDGRDGGKDGRRQDGRRGSGSSRDRGEVRRGKDPLRVSKSTPIRDVVREGQEVIVQVSKEPIGTKGARVTSHISLPGRYVVYLPTVEHIGISKRIGSDKERARLREAIEAMKPPQGGLIVRTLAEGLTKKSLKADVGYLVRLWGEIVKKREMAERAPATLYSELDLVLKTARDLFTDDIEKIVIDSREEYQRLRRFVEMFMPDRVSAIELYEGEEPIFDAYGIEDEIGRALSRKVPLTSGGHLIIDQAEALTAIDVNTGRFVGRGSKDLEDTILQTNLEAVEEIAYQLRFRNIGGLIILDLIDMERISNREKVRRKLEQLLAKDKAKTTLNRISDLGLIEMTRKRTRESLGRIMNEPCFYCDGTGNLQSRQTVAYEILRQIKRERLNLRGYSVVVNAHPAVVDFLKNEERSAITEAEKRYQRRIELVPRKEYHMEQFDLFGK